MCVLHSIKLICYPRAPSAADWDWLGPKVEGLTCSYKTRFTNLQLLHDPIQAAPSTELFEYSKWSQMNAVTCHQSSHVSDGQHPTEQGSQHRHDVCTVCAIHNKGSLHPYSCNPIRDSAFNAKTGHNRCSIASMCLYCI